jgi:DNA-binding response OmpR family regulator
LSTTTPTVVAIFNSSEDTIDMLRFVLERAGFVVVWATTQLLRDAQMELSTFIEDHRPTVIVYDIAPPYDSNWNLFQHISAHPACRGIHFVVTTTNAAHVSRVAGSEQRVFEIAGKPYDLDQIVAAVTAAANKQSVVMSKDRRTGLHDRRTPGAADRRAHKTDLAGRQPSDGSHD